MHTYVGSCDELSRRLCCRIRGAVCAVGRSIGAKLTRPVGHLLKRLFDRPACCDSSTNRVKLLFIALIWLTAGIYFWSLAQVANFFWWVFVVTIQYRQSVSRLALSDSREEDLADIGLKRKYKSMITSLAWERYVDEVGSTQPWSADCRKLIADVMMSCGVEEMPVILLFPSHMHSVLLNNPSLKDKTL